MKTIRTKMIMQILPAIFLVLAISAIASLLMSIRTQREFAYSRTRETGRRYANEFDILLRSDLTRARALAQTMEAYRSANRAEVRDILHRTLASSPHLLGAYVAFEPDAFDGQDSAFANTPGAYPSGRFAPYWNRLHGRMHLDTANGADTLDWYQRPKQTRSCQMIGPYRYEGVLMISFVCPIMRAGKFAGVAGVDVAPATMDETVSHVRPFHTGYAFLVNRDGKFVSYPRKSLVGTGGLDQLSRQTRNPALERIGRQVRAGREGAVQTKDPISGEQVVMFYSPIATGHWSMVLVAPVGEIYAEVNRLAYILGLISFLSLLFAAAIMVAAARSITRPIAELRQVAERVADGDLNATAAPQDGEIGVLASTLNHMTSQLRETLTAEREAKEALEAANRDWEATFNAISDAVWVLDLGHRVVRANKATAEIFGCQPDEVQGRYCWETVHPEGALPIVCPAEKATHTLRRESMELQLDERWFDVTVDPILDEDGNLTNMVHIVKDITERKETDNALAESEERFRSFTQRSPIPIAISDRHGRLTYVSDSFRRVFGYTLEDIPDLDAWLRRAYPDEAYRREVISTWQGLVDEADRESHAIQSHEYRVTCKDGSTRTVEISGAIVGREYLILLDDVTERKRTEEALRESTSRLADIINFLPDATFAIDLEGKVIAWSRAVEDMTGVKAEDIIGKGEQEYSLAFYSEKQPMLIGLVLKPDEEVERNYPMLVRQDHTILGEAHTPVLGRGGMYLWGKASPLYDSQGNMVGAIESVRDVTDRKMAEQALVESEERFRTLFEGSSDAVLVIDGLTSIECNSKAVEIYGCADKSDIVGVPLTKFAPDTQADGKSSEESAKRYGAEALSGKVQRFMWKSLRKDGTPIDVEVSLASISLGGKTYLQAVIRDVTERKRAEDALRRSEESYRRLYESMLDGFAAVDMKGRLLAFNQAFSAMLGYDPEELRNVSYTDLTPERWHDFERHIIEQEVMRRGYSDIYEKEYRRKDGSEFPVELRSYLLRDEKGQPTGMWAVVRDITERKRVDEEKRQFYRDTIRSATDGKLEISDPAATEHYLAEATVTHAFSTAAELSLARQEAETFCIPGGLEGDALGLFMTGLGEAMTNALKHASGGQVFCGLAHGELWVGVSDSGMGIATLTLPRATLQRGYSTKVSMGMGYSIMMDVSDRVMLSTGPSGTTVVLLKSLKEERSRMSLADLQDTWDSIPS